LAITCTLWSLVGRSIVWSMRRNLLWSVLW
jgi:hypothetical protein